MVGLAKPISTLFAVAITKRIATVAKRKVLALQITSKAHVSKSAKVWTLIGVLYIWRLFSYRFKINSL
jgi:hypothetical protein